MYFANEDIVGARVQRAFRMGEKFLLRGTNLTATEVRSIPLANRSALIDKGFLHVQLKGTGETGAAGERFVVPRGFGRYDVVEGHQLNADGPLSREDAYALARKPLPSEVSAAPAKPARKSKKEH